MKDPQVFLLNYSGHDISALNEYGKVIYLTKGNAPVFSPDRLMFKIEQILVENNFDSGHDYIVPSGSPIISLVVGLLLSHYNHLTLLIWDARNRNYKLRELYYGSDRQIN